MFSRKPYNSDYDGTILTKINIREITGAKWEDFFCITGVYGACKYSELLQAEILKKYPTNQLVITHKEFDIETFALLEIDVIHAEYIRAPDLGFKIMKSQIEFCTQLGFKEISCYAARGKHYDGTYMYGYNVWHQYGFLMDDESKSKFDEWISDKKSKKKLPNDIEFDSLLSLTNNPDHPKWKDLWREEGIPWHGFFSLEETSKSQNIFKKFSAEYEKEKRKKLGLN